MNTTCCICVMSVKFYNMTADLKLFHITVLTSLVLQTLDRVIPQAFPGTAFHGKSPVKKKIKVCTQI